MIKLPHSVVISLKDLDFHPFEDDLDDLISDYLSDTYGFCHYGFDYETDIVAGVIHVTDIFWDTEG